MNRAIRGAVVVVLAMCGACEPLAGEDYRGEVLGSVFGIVEDDTGERVLMPSGAEPALLWYGLAGLASPAFDAHMGVVDEATLRFRMFARPAGREPAHAERWLTPEQTRVALAQPVVLWPGTIFGGGEGTMGNATRDAVDLGILAAADDWVVVHAEHAVTSDDAAWLHLRMDLPAGFHVLRVDPVEADLVASGRACVETAPDIEALLACPPATDRLVRPGTGEDVLRLRPVESLSEVRPVQWF